MAPADRESFADKEPLEIRPEEQPRQRKGPIGWLTRFVKDLIVRATSTK